MRAVEEQQPRFREIRETLEKILGAFEVGKRAEALALDMEKQLRELEEKYTRIWQQAWDSITQEFQAKGTEKKKGNQSRTQHKDQPK